MSKTFQPLIIDTDAGVDDAIAIMMALAHPDTQVIGITTVNGNVSVDQVTQNVGIILDQYSVKIPIYKGCQRPLLAEQMHSDEIHGADGLGGASQYYPSTTQKPQTEHAALALIHLAEEYANNLTLLTLGPLTNIAMAVRLDKRFADNVARIVVMGGAVEAHGNATPVAEFNIFADPEAAAIVFDAGFEDMNLLSWETTLKHPLMWSEYENLIALDNDHSTLFKKISGHTVAVLKDILGSPGFLLPDPLAAAIALKPNIVLKATHVTVNVEVTGKFGRGLTSVDWFNQLHQTPNCHLVQDVDDAQVLDLIKSALH